jgi:hypothetical protein
VQLGFRLGVGVLLRDVRAELDVLPHRFPKALVGGEPRFIQRLQVGSDKSLALLVGDVHVAVFVDQVPESELTAEPVRPPERLSRKPGQMVHVSRPARGKDVFEDWVCKRLRVEDLL